MRTLFPAKKLLISIEDVSLTEKHHQTAEFFRMLVNESGFYTHKGEEWVTLHNYQMALISR